MKVILYIFLGSFLLFSCSQPDPEPSYSGLLKSITSYGGDSAIFSLKYQQFTFIYDDLKRVKEIQKTSNNITTSSSGFVLFFYEGNSPRPYLMKDSVINVDPAMRHYINNTHFYYDTEGRLIKDSTYFILRNPTYPFDTILIQPLSQHQAYLYTYSPQYNTRVSRVGGAYYTYPELITDTFYIGPDGVDPDRIVNKQFNQDYIDLSYYPEANPFAELNIIKSLASFSAFTGVNFHPTYYNTNLAKKLPKTFDCLHKEAGNDQIINVNIYFSKSQVNKIDTLVFAKRRKYRSTSNLFDFYYTNYSLSYYP